MKIKTSVIGATGYAGVELVRLLLSHPSAEISGISSVSFEGKKISEIYPCLYEVCDDTLSSQEEIIKNSDVVFASLPHGLSEELAKKCTDKVFIDLGADFRLREESEYAEWYGKSFTAPELHKLAVYGLPELAREKIKNARLIANPGCYPTSVALGLYPAIAEGLISLDSIIIDSKSGATGAGRSLTQNTHFCDLNEGFSPYKAGAHRHTPEIEQTLSDIAGERVSVTFCPHLLPINRGILSTIYAKYNASPDEIRSAYESKYASERFVKLLPSGAYANLKNVRMTNNCHISLHFDEHRKTLIIASAIDNMVKGAAGQAIQNMNLIFGLGEDTGLTAPAPAF